MLVNNQELIGKNIYLSVQKIVNKNLTGIISDEELKLFNEHLDTKLADFNPSMMVYGTYNAGKSTLLNALFGQEEKAKTGESPETAEVRAHQYNGYTIYDTPGINAPIEHEEVTEEHLKKTEMVLFVMSNDGSLEEEYVYQRISEIVVSNKTLIIVLNNKRGVDIDSKEALAEIDKVNINLSKIGDRNKIDKIEQKVSLCMVNASTGLQGKLKDKKLMLHKSNLLKLEALINKELLASGSKDVINALNHYVTDFIETATLNIDNNINNVQVQKVEELITSIEKLRQSSSVKLANLVDKQMIRLVGVLEPILLHGGNLQDEIQSNIEREVNKVVQGATAEFEQINSQLKTKIDDFSVKFESLSTNSISSNYIGDLPKNKPETSNDSFLPPGLDGKIKEVLSNSKAVEEATKQVLTLAKKILPKGAMFGKGPVWIGKTAGKVGPAINVAVAVFEAYSAYSEHENMIKEKRQQVISAKNVANNIADEVKTSLYFSINETLSVVFDDLIINFRNQSKQLVGCNKGLIEKKDALKSAQNSVLRLI